MNSNQLLENLDRLRGLKNKERETEMTTLLQDDFVRDVAKAALDPFTRYGVHNVPMPDEPASLNWCFSDATWILLHKLSFRQLTGHAARDAIVEEMLQLSNESRELLRRILTKDLRCGAGPKTFNKACPGLVPIFEMQTCHAYDPKRVEKWPVVCEIKYDGTRVACVWEDQELSIVSRNGLPMPGFEPFARDMKARLRELKAHGVSLPDMILDGEMDSAEGFYETVGGARRKDGQGEFIPRLFDAVPLAHFKAGKVNAPWRQRCTVARTLVKALAMERVTFDPGMECYSDEDVQSCFAWAREHNHEGIIVKQPDAPYECKRGYHWMKIKPKATVDIPIIGFEVGTGRNARRLGAAICDLEGVEVRVGTGWSDEDRTGVWLNQDQCLGLMIEVEYAEKTPDGSLRHPRFVRWRDDKNPEDGPGV